MPASIPDSHLDLFRKPAFGSLATLMPGGQPQVTPVWCDVEGGLVVVNSAVGRVKDRNVRRDPRVAIMIIDPDNPYRYLQVRGRVLQITQDGADAHIDRMAQKYLGKETYPWRGPNEVRVLYKIQPDRVQAYGS